MKKTAFSMIEILFVMILISALIAIVTPNYKETKENMYIINMKNDLVSTIDIVNSKYIIEKDFQNVVKYSVDYNDIDNDGYSEEVLIDGTELPVSEYSTITFTAEDCDSNGVSDDGVYIIINNPNTSKSVQFNTCTDAKIKVI